MISRNPRINVNKFTVYTFIYKSEKSYKGISKALGLQQITVKAIIHK